MLFTKETAKQLLEPISDDEPCGVYLKGDRSLYRPLRNEFNVALTSLRKLTQNPDASELDTLHDENIANWTVISDSLFTAFSSQSRDIELIGWMLASQIILDESLTSFAIATDWFAQLTKQNWDAVQPILPEKKLKSETEQGQKSERCTAQLNAFNQLLGESEESSLLYAPILMMPIVGKITFFQYQSAERKGELAALRTEAMRTVQDGREIILALLKNISASEAALQELANTSRREAQQHGASAPNFRTLLQLLEKVKSAITQLTNLKLVENAQQSESSHVAQPNEPQQSQQQATDNEQESNTDVYSQQTVYSQQEMHMDQGHSLADVASTNSMNRDKAFHQLRELAEFFRVSEPHSPVSFLIEKAIRWGYMPLPDLLNELLAEKQGSSEQIFTMAGLDQTEQTTLPTIATRHTTKEKGSAATPAATHSALDMGTSTASASASSDVDSTQQSETKKTSSSSSSLRW